MTSKQYCLVNIGTVSFPDDYKMIFSSDEKYLISPTLHGDHYFEMAGESMFYAILQYEEDFKINLIEYKEKIIKALTNRIDYCEGKLFHHSLSNKMDIQLRSSSSAIRILILAKKSGFEVDYYLKKIINIHYNYLFKYNNGIWFCHDSSEFENNGPKTHLKSHVFNKQLNNTLTLNTHLDTLNTLLIIKEHKLDSFLIDNIDNMITSSIESINYICRKNKNRRFLEKLNDIAFSSYLNHPTTLPSKIYTRFLHPITFKFFSPTFFFLNGFISRDMAVMNCHLDYLLVNLADLVRFISLFDRLKNNLHVNYDPSIYEKILKGISLAESEVFKKNFLLRDKLAIAWYNDILVNISKVDPNFITPMRRSFLEHNNCCRNNLF